MKIIRPTAIAGAAFVSSTIPEADHAAYNAGTTYAAGDNVISAATHRIYESLQSGNVGHALPVAPEVATDWWLDVGATNRWRMFDGGVSIQSEDEGSIEVELQPGRVDSLALLNVDAATYRVVLIADAEIVYDTGEVPLAIDDNISNWYEYFFEPTPIRRTDVVLTDIPPYTGGVLTVTLSSPTDVKLGELIVGLARELGGLQWAPRVGIVDYSVKAIDPFGNVAVTERAYSKRLTAEVFMANAVVDEVARILALYRATPLVWVGSEIFTSTILFGYYRSFDIVIASPGGSVCSLEIESLP